MRTVVRHPQPPELEKWLERRRALGQDMFDEIWEGEYHVAPGPSKPHSLVDDQLVMLLTPRARAAGLYGGGPTNIGEPDNYRVPDRVYLRDRSNVVYSPSAAIVVEIVSPGDESWAKLDFYFHAGVEELLIVDPHKRGVHWLQRGKAGFEHADGSRLLGLSTGELAGHIDWPPL